MNEQVSELSYKLSLDGKIRYAHDIAGTTLPFYTRNPERAKFTNGFNPIVGVIARILNGKSPEMQSVSFNLENALIESDIPQSIIDSLFAEPKYRNMNSSKLLQFFPLSKGQEQKGEVRVGNFIVDLLKLKENPTFISLFSEKSPSNLYEKVIYDALKADNSESSKIPQNDFKFHDQEMFVNLFKADINNLAKNQDYFYSQIGNLLEFYYFFYVTQLIPFISLNVSPGGIIPTYFLIGDESVSQSRLAVKEGYGNVYQHGQDLLIDTDILNYLNYLIPDHEKFYWKSEILVPDFEYRDQLKSNLTEFLELFSERLPKAKVTTLENDYSTIESSIVALSRLLNIHKDATNARYPKSFEAIAKQGFAKQHGRLGNTFTLDNEMLLMLTTTIVGQGRMLLNQVFSEFQKRGIFFDRITRDKVISLYEQANILEKLSDSGDAQYVRGIF